MAAPAQALAGSPQPEVFTDPSQDLSPDLPADLPADLVCDVTSPASESWYALLDGPTEQALAARIHKGRLAQTALGETTDGMTPAQVTDLHSDIADGQRARDRFICANLRLVASIARRYDRRGMPLEDLVQEGVFGLYRAVDRFDASKGFRFSTYATWWIRQAVQEALTGVRLVRRPHHVEESLRKVHAVEAALHLTLGRTPTPAEIADHAGITPTRYAALLHWDAPQASLDAPSEAEGAWSLAMALPDDAASESFAAVEVDHDNDRARAREVLIRTLGDLPERQRQVLCLRYGFLDTPALDLTEVADRLGLDVLTVRRAEVAALRTLRACHPTLRERA